MTDALTGLGIIIGYGDGASPEVFTPVAEIKGVSGPSISKNMIEATHSQSLEGWAEFIGGILTAGEVTFEANFLPLDASQDEATGVLGIVQERVNRNWQILIPTSPVTPWIVPGQLSGYDPSMPFDDKLTVSLTLTPSGKPTLG